MRNVARLIHVAFRPFTAAACVCLCCCGCREPAPAEELLRPTESVDSAFAAAQDLSGENSVTLDLNALASLPPRLVLAGGSFDTPADPVAPALLVSQDGGAHWRVVPLRQKSCRVARFATWGTQHAWALIEMTAEGCREPAALLRTRDAGASWECCQLDLPASAHNGLLAVSSLEFINANDGLMKLEYIYESSEAYCYATRDGGKTWRQLFACRQHFPEIERNWSFSGEAPEPTTPCWSAAEDFCQLESVLRLRADIDGNRTVFEKTRPGDGFGSRWEAVSTLPRKSGATD